MRIHYQGQPTPDEALALFEQVFPVPGSYVVDALLGDFTKAKTGVSEEQEPFPEWFLAQLEEVAREKFASARDAIWMTLDRLLDAHGVITPTEMDAGDLQQALFDLSHCSTARMVGLDVRADVAARLRTIGFTTPEVLDFPGWAYRMGRIYDHLQASGPIPFHEVAELAKQYPMAKQELAAIDHVRRQGAMYLRPIFDATGNVWAIERDQAVVQGITERSIARRIHPLEAARELADSNRGQKLFRDAERVMRTEMADARSNGAWNASVGGLPPDHLVYRRPSPRACSECVRLYLDENGQPRLFSKSEVEAEDALGVNSRKPFHVRVGVTHPNCVCGPWLVHYALPLRAVA